MLKGFLVKVDSVWGLHSKTLSVVCSNYLTIYGLRKKGKREVLYPPKRFKIKSTFVPPNLKQSIQVVLLCQARLRMKFTRKGTGKPQHELTAHYQQLPEAVCCPCVQSALSGY
jgi:hypothetical protein